MPWGKKEDVAAAVEEMFGMKPEDVKARLAKIDELNTTLNGVKDLATTQSTTMAEIREAIGKISTPYNKAPVVDDKSTTVTYQADWGVDADAAFKERSQETLRPVIAGILDTRSIIAKREAIDEINGDPRFKDVPFHTLSAEITKYTETASLEQKANPEFWKNVYKVCLSEKRDEIARDREAKKGRFFTESGSSSIVVSDEDKTKPEDKLTAEELNAAKKSGLSPAVYAAELATMRISGRK